MPSLNKYHSNPSQEGYRDYWDIYKHYCYTSEEMSAGEKMMEIFAYNNISYNLAIEKFYPIFESKWVPNNIPTLTIASDKDFVCPHDVFIKDNNFNRPNIINRIISEAGHCPWINQLSQVQGCFNEFLNLYNRFKDT
jgi:pimeloyl-ACP methyl ester carboxylesterase